ncbi:MAG: formiminoglutamase [Marinilabiliales bacterium]|nr:MAG: formiminoglutamase [Marinilabiliales bacterium]
MKLADYFDPVAELEDYRLGESSVFGTGIQANRPGGKFPGWEKADIAIIGISEYRGSHRDNCSQAADRARECLYNLSRPSENMKIADLGNLRSGKTHNDSLVAIADIATALTAENTIPLLIGGSSDIAAALFRAFEKNKRVTNLTSVDSRPGMASDHFPDAPPVQSWLAGIISSKSKYLFNYTSIGYQSYFTGTLEKRLLDDMMFDGMRLGLVRENLKEAEPVIRDTDLMVMSMSAVRQADAPAALFPSPNGFHGEEICQLAWYAGKSERLSAMAITNWFGGYDVRDHTARQAAQMAWYFADGFYRRDGEYPFTPSADCTKFIVNLTDTGNEIVFYKSNKSDRWWMEVPSSKLPKSLMVACSYEDYQRACHQEVPERWWQNFRKVNH